jgi:hypothetical protein
VRLILTVDVHEDWKEYHMDVKSASLNTDLVEEVTTAKICLRQ